MGMDIDSIFLQIGEFGPYQRKKYFLLCLPIIFVAMSNLAFVFIGVTPDHYRCIVPVCDKNMTHKEYNTTFLAFAIPYNETTGYSKCQRYAIEPGQTECNPEAFSNATREKCPEGKIFDTTVYKNSIVTEFNITCDDSWEANMAQSIYFGGVLVGALTFGFISDWIGRMVTLMIGLLLMVVSGVIIALVTNLTVFNILRFINAMMTTGVFQTAFVLGVEYVGPNYRVMCGIIGEYFYAFGEVLLGLVALWLREWRMIQLVISTPAACFVFYKWFIPESPRWLQAKGKVDEAFQVLQKVAKGNGIDVTLSQLQQFGNKDEEHSEESWRNKNNDPTLIDVMKNHLLCVRMLSMFFIWIVTTLVYYGLSLNATTLTNDDTANGPYYDFILIALVEVPGYSLAWLGMARWGRRGSLASSLILAGVCCAGAGYAEDSGVVNVMIPALLGKCFITCSFGIIYVFTSELFPTNVRSTVVGLCSTSARVGAMLAPFSSDLAKVYVPLPMLVFGGLSLVAGLLNIVMPETLGTELPDTVQEAVMLGKRGGIYGNREVRETSSSGETQPLLQEDHHDNGGDMPVC